MNSGSRKIGWHNSRNILKNKSDTYCAHSYVLSRSIAYLKWGKIICFLAQFYEVINGQLIAGNWKRKRQLEHFYGGVFLPKRPILQRFLSEYGRWLCHGEWTLLKSKSSQVYMYTMCRKYLVTKTWHSQLHYNNSMWYSRSYFTYNFYK